MTTGSWLPLFVAVPLGAAFILPLVRKWAGGDRLADVLSSLVAAFLLALSLGLLSSEGTITYWMGGWGPPSIRTIGINLVADGLSRLLLCIISFVTFAVTLFSVPYMKKFTAKPLYFSLFLLMVTGMNGVVISGDLFNLYVFLEIASIASYALVAYGCEAEELEASFKYLVLGGLASTFVLFGIGIIYNVTGTLNMAEVSVQATKLQMNGSPRAILLAACFFFMGFGLKAAMVPFHAWLPDAHPSAPAPISAMLSGVLIKALGVYALCRILFCVLGVTLEFGGAFAAILIVLGVLSMVIGGLLALGQWDFKRLLAYSSVSQMGYVVLALGVGAQLFWEAAQLKAPVLQGHAETLRIVGGWAVFGGLFHLFNHAAFKSLLFLCSGAVEYATGTRQLKSLGGLSQRMPITSGCCRIGSLSIAGVPPFSGFWSKLIIIASTVWAALLFTKTAGPGGGYFHADAVAKSTIYFVLAGIAVVVSFITLLMFIKVQRYVLHGELKPAHAGVREVPVLMCVGMILLAVVCTLAGVLVFWQPALLAPAKEILAKGLEYSSVVLGG